SNHRDHQDGSLHYDHLDVPYVDHLDNNHRDHTDSNYSYRDHTDIPYVDHLDSGHRDHTDSAFTHQDHTDVVHDDHADGVHIDTHAANPPPHVGSPTDTGTDLSDTHTDRARRDVEHVAFHGDSGNRVTTERHVDAHGDSDAGR